MELDSLFPIDDLNDVDSFLREVDLRDEAILIKDNRPMYRVVRIGSEADRRMQLEVIRRVDLWNAMKEALTEVPGKTAHAKEIANIINARKMYCTRSGSPVTAVQIRSRAEHKPEIFECLKGNFIRLIEH